MKPKPAPNLEKEIDKLSTTVSNLTTLIWKELTKEQKAQLSTTKSSKSQVT